MVAWMVMSRYVRDRNRRRRIKQICDRIKQKRSELQLGENESSHERPRSRFPFEGSEGWSEHGLWGSEYGTDVSLAGMKVDVIVDHDSTDSLAVTLC